MKSMFKEDSEKLRKEIDSSLTDVWKRTDGIHGDVEALSGKLEALNELLEESEEYMSDDQVFQRLQLRHGKLFTGDLSKLEYGDRRELFELIRDYHGDQMQDAGLSRIEARL